MSSHTIHRGRSARSTASPNIRRSSRCSCPLSPSASTGIPTTSRSSKPMRDVTAAQFAALIEMAETDRVYVFSSDYPHYDADVPDHVLGPGLPEPLRSRVRYQNALDTFPRLGSLTRA